MSEQDKAFIDIMAVIHDGNPDVAKGILIGARMTADALASGKKEAEADEQHTGV